MNQVKEETKLNTSFKGIYDTSKKSYLSNTTEPSRPSNYSFRIENYRDLKNYIHNYIGLTKEEVKYIFKDILEGTVQEEVKKIMNDEEGLKRIIRKEISNEIKRQYNSKRSSYIVSTMDDIYNRIDRTIHNIVKDRLIIELKGDDEDNGEVKEDNKRK